MDTGTGQCKITELKLKMVKHYTNTQRNKCMVHRLELFQKKTKGQWLNSLSLTNSEPVYLHVCSCRHNKYKRKF